MYSKSMLAVLALIPYGWTVVAALLMCWMVVQLDNRKDKKKRQKTGGNTTTYGDIQPGVDLYYHGTKVFTTRTKGNRETWRDFFDEEDF